MGEVIFTCDATGTIGGKVGELLAELETVTGGAVIEENQVRDILRRASATLKQLRNPVEDKLAAALYRAKDAFVTGWSDDDGHE